MSVNRYKDGQLTLIAGSGDSNTFTGTKAEVEQAIAAGKIKENWTVYITDDLEDIVNTPGSSNCDCKVEYLTQEQYNALPEDKLTNDIEYRITDNNPATPSAKNMAYDSSTSGLEAVNVQDAIDTVNESVSTLSESLNAIILDRGETPILSGNSSEIAFSVNFNKKFSKIPCVSINLTNDSFTYQIGAVTNTGFNGYIKHISGGTIANVRVSWFALSI